MRVIRLRGARTHNLQRIDLDLEPGTLLVVTGPSGAGKSSLAFGTLYAEGQRRYVESFSAYARQFLERLARPDVDSLEPVPAAIAVDRRAPVKTSRSTVATLTELTDYAKQVWAHFAELTCTRCGAAVHSHTPETAYRQVASGLAGERVVVTYPVSVRDAEHFLGVRDELLRAGYRRLWHAGGVRDLDELRPSELLAASPPTAAKAKRKAKPLVPVELKVVTDRAQALPGERARLIEALEAAFERGAGRAAVISAGGKVLDFSEGLACDACGAQYRRPSPGLFSYNSPIGACENCRGFGRVIDVDWDKVIPDRKKSLNQGAIKPWNGKSTSWERKLLARYCARAGVSMDVPYQKLTAAEQRGLLEGDGGSWRSGFPGLRRWFKWLESRAYKMHVRVLLSRYRKYIECDTCHGTRFKPDVLAYRVGGLTLPEFYRLSVRDARRFLEELRGGADATTAPALRGGADATTAPALRGGADATTAPALRGGADATTAPALRGGAHLTPAPALRGGADTTPAPALRGGAHPTPAPALRGGAHPTPAPALRGGAHPTPAPALRGGADPRLRQVLAECEARLATLDAVGLHYLTLDRSARTLSGGELQRVSLTTALAASLTGTLFVLDEPTVGLHPADVAALLPVVRGLAQADNVVVVVESDPAFVRAADRVVELGPHAGEQGGRVVFDGPPSALVRADTATARALRPPAVMQAASRRTPSAWLELEGASGNNLKQVDLKVPVGALTCVTGVSGSGKSSLVLDTLAPAVARALGDAAEPLPFVKLRGAEPLRSLVYVDQAPLGRTSRGNPATYLGVWDALRKRFAKQPLALERGYTPGTFSFNVAGGRCEACRGEGAETVEMQFLSDVTFSCPECGGKRFAGPVLDVQLAGYNVAEVLQLSAQQARQAFAAFNDVCKALDPLIAVGAGYLRLGQALNTLSGGEAQRLKLAAALVEATTQALIVLDEPTAGLHAEDTLPLIRALHALVERGNSVLVVEHDMRVVASADYVIDLGPGAGELGGQLTAAGTPEQVARGEGATARALRAYLGGPIEAQPAAAPARALIELPHDAIAVRGAREHNLRSLDLDVPREKLVVVTGPSGSGKSTLAFDVIFAESQRRYLETLSPYVRQYLKQLPRPAVDRVIGAPPSVSLEQRSTGGARNSTVATVTEVAHYLRVVFARAGLLHCPTCALPIAPRAPAALAEQALEHFGRGAIEVLAPVVRGRKGAHRDLLARARADGFSRARIDGRMLELTPRMSLDRFKEHEVDLVLGSLRPGSAEFFAQLTRALQLGDGCVRLLAPAHAAGAAAGQGEELLLSSRRACPKCGNGFPELDPRFFSFNTKQGACAGCEGHGYLEVETKRGAEPLRTLCPECQGKRLAGLALHTTLQGVAISEYFALSVSEANERLAALKLSGREAALADLPLREARLRLQFLERVGLSYLSLDRPAWSLSGGELQRVRLAAQLGSGLTGLLYVLDEPTIGLHPRDTDRLISALRELTEKGCSVLLVEHDAEMIRAADHVIDVGPGGGHEGGRILAQGSPAELARDSRSLTLASLARPLAFPERRRPIDRERGVLLRGASEHNLKDVDLWLPAARFCAVTGVSGSGKSTLVREVFLRAVRKSLGLSTEAPGAYRDLRGAQVWKRAVEIDQTPIGRTPRSVPATYIGIWNEIRKLYAATPEARTRGYAASRFSFNTDKGRCEGCEGQGSTSFEMAFLPEALETCEACGGKRFGSETLSVLLHGKSAGDLLDMDVAEVAQLLASVPKVRRPLELLAKLGLGYLKLGQPSNSLSGGEAQRLKLVSELATSGQGPTLYVMDEPTTGLHREDVRRLLTVLQELVERGDSVVVIEHHPDVIAAADWVVDLGPEGGRDGGTIVAEGTPEELMRNKASHTGRVLKREREQTKPNRRPKADDLDSPRA